MQRLTIRARRRPTAVPRGWYDVFSLVAAVCILAACSPFEPSRKADISDELPSSFSLLSGQFDPSWKWWESFDDPELDALVEEALSDNLTIRQAWARLRQARAVAVRAGADLYPHLDGAGQATRLKQQTRNGSSETTTRSEYSLGVVSGYEVDLWGRIRSEEEAARLESSATEEDVHTAANTVAGEIAGRWIQIISQRNQKRLLQAQLLTNETFLELIGLRFRKSLVSALDVFQQRQIVEAVKAEIPLVEAREQLLIHELDFLLGNPAMSPLAISREDFPRLGQIPPTGLPADLLTNRPDVRAAGLRLFAAEWDVAAKKADRLPAIHLTGEAGFGASHLDLLFDNWILRLTGELVAPIMDGRRRLAEVDRTQAVVQENISIYRETVLMAIKEVEDALVQERKQKERIEALKAVIEVSRKALDQAVERYRNGLNDYLPVLTALLSVQTRERELIQEQALLLIYRVDLHRALGGTWMNELTEWKGPDITPVTKDGRKEL